MKLSRIISKAGLILIAVALWLMAVSQDIAIRLGAIGEQLSDSGFRMMCDGR